MYKFSITICFLLTTWFYVWSLPCTSLYFGTILENIYLTKNLDLIPHADLIIIFGGETAKGKRNWFDKNSLEDNKRINMAFFLYKKKKSNTFLVCGGKKNKFNRSEAFLMKHALEKLGVPSQSIFLDENSRNTYENVLESKLYLQQTGNRTALLVTSAIHMPRAIAILKKQKLNVIPVPAKAQIFLLKNQNINLYFPHIETMKLSHIIVHELLGLTFYKLLGRI